MTALERFNQITREREERLAATPPVPVVPTPTLDTFARVRSVLAELSQLGIDPGTTLAELTDLAAMLARI